MPRLVAFSFMAASLMWTSCAVPAKRCFTDRDCDQPLSCVAASCVDPWLADGARAPGRDASAVRDGSAVDPSFRADSGTSGLDAFTATDLGVTTDQSPPRDMASPRDLAMPRDLLVARDLAVIPDLAARCDDGIQNGEEPAVDCGGPRCPKCPLQSPCVDHLDCQSFLCSAGRCVEPVELLRDGDFDGGDWISYIRYPNEATVFVSRQVFKKGPNGLGFTNSSPSRPDLHWEKQVGMTFPAAAGHCIRIRLWHYAPAQRRVVLELDGGAPGYPSLGFWREIVMGGVFDQYEAWFVLPSSHPEARLMLHFAPDGGDGYTDSWSIADFGARAHCP